MLRVWHIHVVVGVVCGLVKSFTRGAWPRILSRGHPNWSGAWHVLTPNSRPPILCFIFAGDFFVDDLDFEGSGGATQAPSPSCSTSIDPPPIPDFGTLYDSGEESLPIEDNSGMYNY